MNDETPRPRSSNSLRWGIPASVALHLVFAAVLFLDLPFEMPAPQTEESVSVEIVPPPEEKKPEPPPPPKEEKKEEPPPPPKEEKKEEPPPPPPKQEEKKAEPPPVAAEGQPPGGRVPIPTLRPVFAFGEKDSGPREARDGNAAEEPAAKPPEEKPKLEPKPPTETAEKKEPAAGAKPQPKIDLPKADMADETAKPGAGDLAAETIAALEEAAPESPPKTEAKPNTPTEADVPNDLPEVKKLFSTAITDNPVAKTAMGDMPRDERAAELCVTELREQLRRASPPYRPELLPSFALKTGTVLDVRNAAFRASARWYELRFRCELDANAMTVRSFAFAVGKEIPRSEWKSRGFPVF
ncbi:DUF930 domain-containing protein [Ciceribacter azotifigens]|uniref:DUF930 domain-containing protein n=1 Tax=Ciceribacter azotifigens TaxID=2069303 RepID=UPI003A835B96